MPKEEIEKLANQVNIWLFQMTDEERIDFISRLEICLICGSNDLPCTCVRDE